jgi:hypothetical protein
MKRQAPKPKATKPGVWKKPHRRRAGKSPRVNIPKPRKKKGNRSAILPRPMAFTRVAVRLVTFVEAMSEPQLSSSAKKLADAVPFDFVADLAEKLIAKGQKVRSRRAERIKQMVEWHISGKSWTLIAKTIYPKADNAAKQLRTFRDRHKEEIEPEIVRQKNSVNQV